MEHEDPLDALIELERARAAAIAPEWEDVVTGRMSADEAEQRIRSRGTIDDQEILRLRALFEPLSADFETSLIERLIPTATISLDELEVQEPAAAQVIDRRASAWWRQPAVIGGVVAAAAAALVVLWPNPGPAPDSTRVAAVPGPALPSHDLHLTGVAEVRGTADPIPSVPAGATLELQLRPATRYAFTPTVWGCIARGDVVQPIAIATERSAPGQTILGRVTIPAELAKGEWELVTVITSRAVELADQRCDVAPSSDLRVVREPFAVR